MSGDKFMGSRFIGRIVCAALCASALARATAAQETVNTASVSGRVADPQGMVVPGAQVVARQTDTNVVRETVTDGEGRFRFPYLRIGRYEIKVSLQGFSDVVRTLNLTVGSAFELPIVLAVGGISTDVTVTGDATVLGTSWISRCSCLVRRRPIRPARSCLPKRRPFREAESRSGASEISPTTSSSTDSQPTTTRRG
jgi:hypothetical protein